MITKCPYCTYAKPDKPLSSSILSVLADPDLPSEDYALWEWRLTKTYGTASFNGVKIHIGIKHKGEPNWPLHELSDTEKAILS